MLFQGAEGIGNLRKLADRLPKQAPQVANEAEAVEKSEDDGVPGLFATKLESFCQQKKVRFLFKVSQPWKQM